MYPACCQAERSAELYHHPWLPGRFMDQTLSFASLSQTVSIPIPSKLNEETGVKLRTLLAGIHAGPPVLCLRVLVVIPMGSSPWSMSCPSPFLQAPPCRQWLSDTSRDNLGVQHALRGSWDVPISKSLGQSRAWAEASCFPLKRLLLLIVFGKLYQTALFLTNQVTSWFYYIKRVLLFLKAVMAGRLNPYPDLKLALGFLAGAPLSLPIMPHALGCSRSTNHPTTLLHGSSPAFHAG